MTDDLIQRLRVESAMYQTAFSEDLKLQILFAEAADEIERLRDDIDRKTVSVNALTMAMTNMDADMTATDAAYVALKARIEGAPIVIVMAAGDDEAGQPRVIAHSTRDELGKGGPLVFRRAALVLTGDEPPKVRCEV